MTLLFLRTGGLDRRRVELHELICYPVPPLFGRRAQVKSVTDGSHLHRRFIHLSIVSARFEARPRSRCHEAHPFSSFLVLGPLPSYALSPLLLASLLLCWHLQTSLLDYDLASNEPDRRQVRDHRRRLGSHGDLNFRLGRVAVDQLKLSEAYSFTIAAYAIGPLFFGPASELWGRANVLQLANLIYLGTHDRSRWWEK